MSDTNNNGEQVTKTDSNLPILFANGYPTSLESMKIESLELFLPFLVACSEEKQDFTSDQTRQKAPSWWPEKELPFTIPLKRPRRLKKNDMWEAKLKEVVKQCYISSGNEYLLTYSENLSQIPTDKLQLITESNLTTSLYKKESSGKKLLITFRNENMTYDKRKRLQLWHKAQPTGMISAEEILDEEDEDVCFQIILCEYCDAEFYSDEAVRIHETTCRDRTDSDQERDYGEENIVENIENIVISDDDDVDGSSDTEMTYGGQEGFMAYFSLANSTTQQLPKRTNRSLERIASPKKKRGRTRTRKLVNKKEIENELTISFSSPLGQALARKKHLEKEVDTEYIRKRYDEMNQYCKAKPFTKIPPRVKIKQQVNENNAVFREMRKHRHYYWPKRQLNTRAKAVNFDFLNRPLIAKLKTARVDLDFLDDKKIKLYLERFRQRREEKKRREMAMCIPVSDSDDDEVDDESNLPSRSDNHLVNGTSSFSNMFSTSDSVTIERRGVSTTQFLQSNREISIVSHSSQTRHTITPISTNLVEGFSSTFDHGNPISNGTSNVIEEWLKNVNSQDPVMS